MLCIFLQDLHPGSFPFFLSHNRSPIFFLSPCKTWNRDSTIESIFLFFIVDLYNVIRRDAIFVNFIAFIAGRERNIWIDDFLLFLPSLFRPRFSSIFVFILQRVANRWIDSLFLAQYPSMWAPINDVTSRLVGPRGSHWALCRLN